ncbi:unnamed protein product [Prorocentrum cordatum]|uniref:Endonuclease/exonuclease/phosphatase domain-containing protein n=1 Tax=Prorocentrum cordatum TaxID=2364126 RepID=A0ABN9S782_9DINO|nr:unnamed protein product [Polarella glacialis]
MFCWRSFQTLKRDWLAVCVATFVPNWSTADTVVNWVRDQADVGGSGAASWGLVQIKFQVVTLQETRLKPPDKIISAQSWACRNGYQVSLGKALSTGDGPLQSSGGVGILVAGELASRPLDLPGLGRFDGRIVGRVINAGFDQGLEIYSVYLVNDIGVTGENSEILEVLGALLLCSKRPWIVQGDWNFTPAALQLSGWIQHVHGVLAASGQATCSARAPRTARGEDMEEDELTEHDGGGRELDFFVVSSAISSCIKDVQAIRGAPLFPHCPVLLRLGNLCQTAVVQQQTRFKPFSTALMGPLPQERDIQWSDPLNSDLDTLAREWFGEAEARLVEIHGISDLKGYVGRSAGPQSRKVPLVALLERDHRRRFSKQTVCWISFEALLKKAKAISAGNPGAKGRALLGSWKLKLFDILEDLQLTEDGPTKAQLHTIVRAASGEGSWNDDVNGAICKECTRRQRLDAASQLAKWKEWAKSAVSGGGKAAHAFSKQQDPKGVEKVLEAARNITAQKIKSADAEFAAALAKNTNITQAGVEKIEASSRPRRRRSRGSAVRPAETKQWRNGLARP